MVAEEEISRGYHGFAVVDSNSGKRRGELYLKYSSKHIIIIIIYKSKEKENREDEDLFQNQSIILHHQYLSLP